jgi:hypothetical protein
MTTVRATVSESRKISTAQFETVDIFESRTIEVDVSQTPPPDINQLIKTAKHNLSSSLDDTESIKRNNVPQTKGKGKLLDFHRVSRINGEDFIHVTTVLTPEGLSFVKNIDKDCKIGNYLDTSFKFFCDTGVLVVPDEFEKETDTYVRDGYLKAYTALCDLLNRSKQDIQLVGHSVPMINKRSRYCGELDAYGYYKGIPAIFDCKKSNMSNIKASKDKHFMQMSAYNNAIPRHKPKDWIGKAEVLVIVSPEGLVTTDEINGYTKAFKEALKSFKKEYGF